ncbi:hypothetical protein LCGC14_3158630 [marine sediment metagenome]|uniref:Sulfotransferase domain-containing protein n=1 Tax=marine sediment metagenome TaxID=412755 RepID=A0A0F8VS06_9ZZZZ
MKLAIFGMFRSGTNYLWHLLSKDKRFKQCYTEPLHPHLLDEREKHKHYAIYNDSEIDKYFNWNLAFRQYVMEKIDVNFELKRYLDYLIIDNTLIKINRMSFRINWFRKNFPDVKCAGIVRDPRAFAFAHVLNGAEWDPIFFDLCLASSKFNDYLDPLKDESVFVKLLAFWKLCVEEMLLSTSPLPIMTIEDLNKDRVSTLSNLYESIGLEFCDFASVLPDLVPDTDSYFWGDSTKYYDQVESKVWEEAIEKTGVAEWMGIFGYEVKE